MKMSKGQLRNAHVGRLVVLPETEGMYCISETEGAIEYELNVV